MAKIPIILESGRADGKLVSSDAIFDENKDMFQSEINDIQDTLNSDNSKKPLSAKQGKVLKELLDTKVIETGAVPIDTEPIEGNTTHIVTSDGIHKALAQKVNNTIFEEKNKIQDEKLSELEKKSGHIEITSLPTNSDLYFTDGSGNVLLFIKDGHIYTAKFNTRAIAKKIDVSKLDQDLTKRIEEIINIVQNKQDKGNYVDVDTTRSKDGMQFVDEQGLPYINEKELNAIIDYCVYVVDNKKARLTKDQATFQIAQLEYQQWQKLCSAARAPIGLSQNSANAAISKCELVCSEGTRERNKKSLPSNRHQTEGTPNNEP